MKAVCFLLTVALFPGTLCAGTIILDGTYQGKNIYVQNPFAGNDTGFCTTKVSVNGQNYPFEQGSAYDIDLKGLGFKIGDSIHVEIQHKDDCKPKVLIDNSRRKSSFDVVSMEVSSSGLLKWTAKNENMKYPYVIEQFRWNKWIKIGEVVGKGGLALNSYEFQVTPHSGENKVRVKQVDYTFQPNYSKPVIFNSTIAPVIVMETIKTVKAISFSAETMYELYDGKGNIVKRGFGQNVDCSELSYGAYYLNYDNKITEIYFRKK